MVDYAELMKILSVPRPNGSAALRETCIALRKWLTQQDIAHHTHTFRVRPLFFESIGIWLIVSQTLLALAVWLRWGWLTLPIAVVGLAGSTLDVAFNLPLITWLGVQRSENILIEFSPKRPRQEVVCCAHYDSKTELFDHKTRLFLFERMRLAIILTVLVAFVGPLDSWLLAQEMAWAGLFHCTGVALNIPLLLLAWGLGLNFSIGRLLRPSQGAVDNGTSCAILLGLAKRLADGSVKLHETRVTIALFAGEEVNMQGSRAYVSNRDWRLPTVALNLEIMAQNGDYVYWEQDGTVFKLLPTDSALNRAIGAAVARVTGH